MHTPGALVRRGWFGQEDTGGNTLPAGGGGPSEAHASQGTPGTGPQQRCRGSAQTAPEPLELWKEPAVHALPPNASCSAVLRHLSSGDFSQEA